MVIDNSDRPRLGDPGEWADAIPLSESLIEFLVELGWDPRADTVRLRWLRIACMHGSFIYENQRSLSIAVNAKLLKSFEEVGKRWVALAVLDSYVADREPKTRGEQSAALNSLKQEVNKVIDSILLPLGAVLLGKGESGVSESQSSRSRSIAIRQILGLVALMGGLDAIQRLCRSSYRKLVSTQSEQRDWRTLLEQQARNEGLSWRFVEEGPDHSKTFRAFIQDRRGRGAEGGGRGKKEAARSAAEQFLRRHLPAVVARETSRVSAAPALSPTVYRNPPAQHWQVLCDLRRVFELPSESEPWLCQAMTHSSWTHENRSLVSDAQQRDNGLLAHYGSFVMDALCTHEYVLRLAATNLRPNEDEARMGTPDRYFCEKLFGKLAIGGAVLLSRGQVTNPDISKADVAQAVLAVAWRYRHVGLIERRPKELHDQLGSFAPIHDGYTKLVSMSAPYNIEIDAVIYESGLEHDRYHAVDLLFDSRGHKFTLECDYYPASKTGAKTRSAAAVASLLHAYHKYPGELSDDEKKLIAYYVGRQIANSSEVAERNLQRCILQGHLGLTMLVADQVKAFQQWAKATSHLIGTITEADQRSLQRFYERCILRSRDGSLSVTASHVASFVAWLETLDPEVEVRDPAPLLSFVQFSDHSVLDKPLDLFAVVATSADKNLMSLNIEDGFDADTILLGPSQAAAITMLVDTTAKWSRPATAIDLGNAEDGALVLVHGLQEGFETSAGPLAEFLAELAPSVTCYLDRGDLLIKIAVQETRMSTDTSPIEQAALAALRSVSEAHPVMVDLHRHVPPLVQQVRRFEEAQAASKTTNRTDRYRSMAEASEALDAMSPHLGALKRIVNTLSRSEPG
ncbi:hypothetical protein [Sphaerisporangium sp. NPDC051011]|uniref:hypothetical protein n=1 Tax=Sphaerisporangium sp. NPDC051011 TaxID=3155792 RepID=UPI0033CCDD31